MGHYNFKIKTKYMINDILQKVQYVTTHPYP